MCLDRRLPRCGGGDGPSVYGRGSRRCVCCNGSRAGGAVADDGSVVYAKEDAATKTSVQPTEDGVRVNTVIEGRSSPTAYGHEVTLSDGLRMVLPSDLPSAPEDAYAENSGQVGGVFILDSQDNIVGGFASPWATDANGREVPTHYELKDGNLVQVVDHQSGNYAYPIVADPYLGFDLIKSARWSLTSDGWTLNVTPTLWARSHAGSYYVGQKGWDELYEKYKYRGLSTNLGGMRDQWICHQQIVAIRAPRKPTWNIDEWWPDVSYWETVNTSCNPGGPRWFD